ncbi:MAG: Flp pilus assembly complex ATPase component TadA [Actinobacteria bacterium]|nr:Flp pilus assembly complex ATPase component TadA [Actinomycetota bacterium]
MARKRLGDLLVEWGAIKPEQLKAAIEEQKNADVRRRLGEILVEQEVLDEDTLASALADIHGLPVVNLDFFPMDDNAAYMIPKAMCERDHLIAYKREGDQIWVAVADPVDVVALDDVKSKLANLEVHPVVAPASQVQRHVARVWGDEEHYKTVEKFVEELGEEPDAIQEEDENGAVAIVNQILATAARRNASDVHVEPFKTKVRVRIRVDGVLREMLDLPKSSHSPLVTRMKIIADLQVVERRIPQDGRTSIRVRGEKRDIRVSTLPTIHGEKVVLRLLPTQTQLPSLDKLGMTPEQAKMMADFMKIPQGFALVTGPTGSGKSNTLYSALQSGVSEDRNAITLEDPVEMELTGINQVQINPAVGLTFDQALRSVLRQDPDVVMVGEIRDLETGQLAVRAALTGHLVLSTLHTLDAPSSVRRLLEMGIPDYLVASSLNLVIAQRLVRKPCSHCSQPYTPDEVTIERLGLTPEQSASLVLGTGCPRCDGTGYLGRIGVFEMLQVDRGIRKAVLAGADDVTLRHKARQAGWRPMVERGVEMAVQHLTTTDELIRTLGNVERWSESDSDHDHDHDHDLGHRVGAQALSIAPGSPPRPDELARASWRETAPPPAPRWRGN